MTMYTDARKKDQETDINKLLIILKLQLFITFFLISDYNEPKKKDPFLHCTRFSLPEFLFSANHNKCVCIIIIYINTWRNTIISYILKY